MPRCSKIWQDMARHTDAHGHVVVAEVFVVPGSWWPWLGRRGAKSPWMLRLRPSLHCTCCMRKLWEIYDPLGIIGISLFIYIYFYEYHDPSMIHSVHSIHSHGDSEFDLKAERPRPVDLGAPGVRPRQTSVGATGPQNHWSTLINSEQCWTIGSDDDLIWFDDIWWRSDNLMIFLVNMIETWLKMKISWQRLDDLKYLEISGGLKWNVCDAGWMCGIPSCHLAQGNENTQ
jgi:hypothetical protein